MKICPFFEAVVHEARNPAVVGALEKMTMVGAFAELGSRNYCLVARQSHQLHRYPHRISLLQGQSSLYGRVHIRAVCDRTVQRMTLLYCIPSLGGYVFFFFFLAKVHFHHMVKSHAPSAMQQVK